ncbi:MAG: hypothetical protein JNL79_40565 [Myxococcales bacterium]|nr:hypothetical protein [Myxococcales bacterium]
MELLAGAAFSWCVVYVLLATYFAILAARRGGLGYGAFAIACALASGYAFCNAQQYHQVDPVRSATWGLRGFVMALGASALILHTCLIYAEVSAAARRRWALLANGAALGCAVLAVAGAFHQVGVVRSRTLNLGGLQYLHHNFAGRAPQWLAQAVLLGCIAGSVTLLVRAYLAGKREALLACLGGFVIVATTVNDVLVLNEVTRAIFLSEHGFSAFAFGLSYTLLARHERLSDELTLKGAELRRRARHLRKAYEELRAAQQELVRKEQLALVGELAAVVSHEVRNPLAVISNAIAGLRRETLGPEDRSTLLGILEEESQRLNRLVGDLLRYARPLNVERQRLDLPQLVGRASDLVRNHEGVVLALDVEPIDATPVYGDANLLRQVFDNLVQNACQAMSAGGGTLGVRVSPGVEEGVEGVVVQFADTGEGMDTQVRSRAGTPFFTTRPGGTGLGLAICDRIVTAHGGVLSIKSGAGEGTLVNVFLPANRRSEAPAVRSSVPPRPEVFLAQTGENTTES